MKLKSFGCSLIFGTDLQDDGRHGPQATPSKYTWPALLAKHSKRDYYCYARPGAGNLQILNQLLSNIDSDDTVYVIGWTYAERFDYIDQGKWSSLMPVENSQVARTYYASLQDDLRDQLATLSCIQTAVSVLGDRKFIMICQDHSELVGNGVPGVEHLLQHVAPHIQTFDGSSFLDFSAANKFPVSATQHPLEAAHWAAYELIRSYNLV